jgi:uncharacterized LabA/DUF88 family protein
MPSEPSIKRAIAFIDGQNLFNAVKTAFGYSYPNYDISRLCNSIFTRQSWQVEQIRFYTGLPDPLDRRHAWWAAKLAAMGRQGIYIFTRPTRYANKTVRLDDGKEHTVLVSEEKGIDVRIAIDIISLAHHQKYDVALIFSQDQDLSEAATEIRTIARDQSRWIRIASAYPVSPTYANRRGINGTDWLTIDRAAYQDCIDSTDYRTPRSAP